MKNINIPTHSWSSDLQFRAVIYNEYNEELATIRLTSGKESSVKLSVWLRGERITLYAAPELTLLRSLEQGGVAPPSGCRSGECGFCRTKLLSGRVFIPENSDKRRRADESFGYIHPCCSYPLEDLELEIAAK